MARDARRTARNEFSFIQSDMKTPPSASTYDIPGQHMVPRPEYYQWDNTMQLEFQWTDIREVIEIIHHNWRSNATKKWMDGKLHVSLSNIAMIRRTSSGTCDIPETVLLIKLKMNSWTCGSTGCVMGQLMKISDGSVKNCVANGETYEDFGRLCEKLCCWW